AVGRGRPVAGARNRAGAVVYGPRGDEWDDPSRPRGRAPRKMAGPASTHFVGAASAASSRSLPCEGRGGLGRGVFRLSPNRGNPLPASPCRRRGRGNGKLAAEAAPTGPFPFPVHLPCQ